ncbi:MAG TPA: AI-2E family transporter [Caulobacteraceae bacterium]|jgi:predicted PurR-regulated permease PerM
MSEDGLVSQTRPADETLAHAHAHGQVVAAGVSVSLRNAGVFMAVVVGGFTLKALNGIITPLIIAVFMLLLIDGVSRTMERRFPAWPQWLRSALGVTVTVAGFTGVVVIFAEYGSSFAAQVKVLQPRIDGLLTQVSANLQIAPMTVSDLFRGDNPASAVSRVFGAARGVISEAVLVMIYLGFLLASRQAFGRKAERLFPGRMDRSHAERIFGRVRYASEQYIVLQTVKAAIVALTAWGLMTAVGVANPLFIAFILFLASYVPIVGGIGASVLPALIALAQFESPVRPLVLVVSLGGAIFMIENVLLPKLQSDRLNLDPVFILLSLGFWGEMLGLPGVLLSTPLTVVVMSIAAEFKGARWLAILLSKDGDLGQRL